MEGRQLHLAVVNEAFNNVREGNRLLGYKNSNRSFFQYVVRFSVYKLNNKFLFTCVANSSFGIFKLPLAAIKAREFDICKQVTVNSIDYGEFGQLGRVLLHNANGNCALFENLACCKLYKLNIKRVFTDIANCSLGIFKLPCTDKSAGERDICKLITVNRTDYRKLGNLIQHRLVNSGKRDVILDNTREVVGDLFLVRSIVAVLGPALKAVSIFCGCHEELVKLQLVGVKQIAQAGSLSCFLF